MKLARYRHAGTDGWGVVDTTARTISPIAGTIAEWGPAVTEGGGEPSAVGRPIGIPPRPWRHQL
jgi:hypothetical protein